MLSPWHSLLIVGAIFTACTCLKNRRGLFWLICGSLASIISGIYSCHDNLKYPEAISAICDMTICLLIYLFGEKRWEMVLYRLFQVSSLLSILALYHFLPDHFTYEVGLETVNWLAIGIILGINLTGKVQFDGYGNLAGQYALSLLYFSVLSLRSKRSTGPFYKEKQKCSTG